MSVFLSRVVSLAVATTFLSAVPADCSGENPDIDIVEQLESIEGLTFTEESSPQEGYRFFVLNYEQPADHNNPDGQMFEQRATLLHKHSDEPTVLAYSGYYVSTRGGLSEPARLLGANQLSVEHRFFEPSRPDPANWDLLTIEQASADFHRLVEAFDSTYQGSWINTGGSKGGMTSLFHKYHYPDDLDGTVAYVAPISVSDVDERFPTYLSSIGDADCQEDLIAFQQDAVSRREAIVPMLEDYAEARNLVYEHIGFDRAFEHGVVETRFVFWQYGGSFLCPTIPRRNASDSEVFNYIDNLVGWSFFSDSGIDTYVPYFYQAAVQLGGPAAAEEGLDGMLRYPGTDVVSVYVPDDLQPVSHDPEAMAGLLDWIAREGDSIMLIYGEWDPWTAAAVDLGRATDSYSYYVEEGNHGSSIGQLGIVEQNEATSVLEAWANSAVVGELDPNLTWSGEDMETFRQNRPMR